VCRQSAAARHAHTVSFDLQPHKSGTADGTGETSQVLQVLLSAGHILANFAGHIDFVQAQPQQGSFDKVRC
jgi:hypothetical protein